MTLDRRSATEAPALDHPLLPAAVAFWQLPFLAFTGWCNLMTGAWCTAPHGETCEDSRHCQLVVPEAIEVTGEHALFA